MHCAWPASVAWGINRRGMVNLIVDKEFGLHLYLNDNAANDTVAVAPQELMGFNVGCFQEINTSADMGGLQNTQKLNMRRCS